MTVPPRCRRSRWRTAPSPGSQQTKGLLATSVPLARRAAAAAFFGTALEWYDYFLYGSAAALVFPELFFTGMEPAVATIVSLATFGVSFLFRPLGGIIFGHFGDRLGRKRMLVLTLLLMGGGSASSSAVSRRPASIGTLAPILLILLRIVQGIGLGGEWGGAATVVVESAPDGKRGLYAVLHADGRPGRRS